MPQFAYIAINKATMNVKTGRNHGNTLKALGYNVTMDETTMHFKIEHEGLIEGMVVDLTDDAKALELVKGLVQAKKLLSYNCTFKAIRADGEVTTLPGIHGARYLNQVFPNGSCLVAKAVIKKSAAKASTFSVADILAD